MSELPTRESVRKYGFVSAVKNAYARGDLLTREEAANDPEVQQMVLHDWYAFDEVTYDDGTTMGYAGAWIVTGYNYDPIPAALFSNELEARRWADINGYDAPDFWPFGTEWHQRWKNGVQEVTDNE